MFHRFVLLAAAVTIPLGACSPGPEDSQTTASSANASVAALPSDQRSNAPVESAATPTPAATPTSPATVLGLEGLGDLRIGQPVPAVSSWAERGAQASDACRTVTSPDYPGAYAIVEDGKVQRITLGQRSVVKLAEGIGVGADEADVQKWFAGFREEPHKYEEAPAKYLTAPNASADSSALRFEIGQDHKVRLIHVGLMPVLGYVEGCS